MDFFMDSRNVVDRLLAVYKEHGKLLIAFDFDDSVFNTHNRTNASYDLVHELLRELRPYARFMCFTASWEERFPFIKQFCNDNGLPLDVGVNDDLETLGWKTRKPYFNAILDDRCGLRQTYEDLCEFLKIVSGKDINRLPKETKSNDNPSEDM